MNAVNSSLATVIQRPNWIRQFLSESANPFYSRLLHLLLINGLIIIHFAGPKPLYAIYPVLAFWALLGPRQAIQALSLAWIPGMMNPFIFPLPYFLYGGGSEIYTALRWLVVLAAFTSVSVRAALYTLPLPRIFALLLYFFIAALPGCLLVSFSPTLSLLKFASFAMGFIAVVLAFRMSKKEHPQLAAWFFDLAVVVVAWNVALLFNDSAYRTYDALYMGVFSQPQITGAVVALIMVWVAGNAAVRNYSGWQSWLVIAGCAAVLYESGSRTAAYSAILGLGVVIVLAYFANSHWRAETYAALRKVGLGTLVVFTCLTIGIVMRGGLDGIRDFVVKRETALGAPIETTRNFKRTEQMLAFKENPFIGNGFGVPSTSAAYYYPQRRDEGFSLSAPVEKNFMPTAVLEEVGILGAVVFMFFLFGLVWPIFQWGSFASGWLAFAVLFSNMGEVSFFSFGGIGLFVWVMFGLARSNITYSDIGSASGPGVSPDVKNE